MNIARGWFLIQQRVERDHWWYRGRRQLLRRLLPTLVPSRVNDAREPRILDVGSGCGVNAETLARYGRPVLLDRSSDALEFARDRGVCCQGDGERLPFRTGSFDLVCALDILEHLDDDRAGMRELARVVAPGGKLLVMVPAFEVLWGPQDDSSLHRRRYSKRALVALARAAGLGVDRAWFFNLVLLAPIFAARKAITLLRLGVENENEINTPVLNGLLERIFGADARLSLSLDYPAGVSLALVATKPPE
ncbi:MAG: class I SAM-dependent methyltransferase [Planctomycetota bacterium]